MDAPTALTTILVHATVNHLVKDGCGLVNIVDTSTFLADLDIPLTGEDTNGL